MTIRETWMERVAAWRASGMGAAKYCEDQPFSAASLYVWARRLRGSTGESGSPVPLARVLRSARAELSRESPLAPLGFVAAIEVGGARVLLTREVTPATVGAVLEALDRRTRGAAR